jgi:hypothetical protein
MGYIYYQVALTLLEAMTLTDDVSQDAGSGTPQLAHGYNSTWRPWLCMVEAVTL